MKLKLTYKNLVNWRGNLVKEQVRLVANFPGATVEEAKQQARVEFRKRTFDDYLRIKGNVANLEPGERIRMPGSLRCK